MASRADSRRSDGRGDCGHPRAGGGTLIRALIRLSLVAALALAGVACQAGDGAPHPDSTAPRRICSLTLASDEILAELVPRSRIVGVSYLVDDEAFSNVVGVYGSDVARLGRDPERLVALRPDLVCVASYVSRSTLELLARSGIPTLSLEEVRTLADVRRNIRALATRVGASEEGDRLIAGMDARLEKLRSRLPESSEAPKVLAWTAGFGYGPDTSVGGMIEAAGGRNVLAEMGLSGYHAVSDERVVEAAPDALILEGEAGAATARLTPGLRTLDAVRRDRIVRVPGRSFSTLSHHIVDGIELMARGLHPERFRDTPR